MICIPKYFKILRLQIFSIKKDNLDTFLKTLEIKDEIILKLNFSELSSNSI